MIADRTQREDRFERVAAIRVRGQELEELPQGTVPARAQTASYQQAEQPDPFVDAKRAPVQRKSSPARSITMTFDGLRSRCTMPRSWADQVAGEVERFCRELPAFYRRFGFQDVSMALSLRPDNRLRDDAWWDRAEREIAEVVAGLGLPCVVQPGAGAIYGPKLEFILRDRRDRPWQCGTIQLDFVMPQRFDVRYVDAGGERRHVVMLHRALFGSIERFLGILLEQHGAALPAWLAPEQVAVVPVTSSHHARAAEICTQLARAGLRSRLDGGSGTLARRIAVAHHDGVPFVVVIGDREVAGETLAIRARDGHWTMPVREAVVDLARRCAGPG